jgi:TatD DNase family protein
VPQRGKINEPAFVVHTLRKLAEVRAMPAERLAEITTENFFRLFSKVQAPSSLRNAPAA